MQRMPRRRPCTITLALRMAPSCAVRKENSSKGCGEMKANLEPVRAGVHGLPEQCYEWPVRA